MPVVIETNCDVMHLSSHGQFCEYVKSSVHLHSTCKFYRLFYSDTLYYHLARKSLFLVGPT